MAAAEVRRARSRTLWCGISLLALFVAGSAGADPVVYTVDPLTPSRGVDVAQACTGSLICGSVVFTQDGSPDPVGGTITIDTTLLRLSFDLSGSVAHNGSTNGVTEADFLPISYVASDLVLSPALSIASGSFANLNLNLVEDGGSPVPLAISNVRVTGSCLVGASSMTCGFDFGAFGSFPVGIGDPDATLYFQHTMNLFAVPEPGSAILLGFAVAGLLFARRGQPS